MRSNFCSRAKWWSGTARTLTRSPVKVPIVGDTREVMPFETTVRNTRDYVMDENHEMMSFKRIPGDLGAQVYVSQMSLQIATGTLDTFAR